MKSLDGIQGPVYVGTGCVFNRRALYGYDPQIFKRRSKMTCDCWPSWNCCCFGGSESMFDLEEIDERLEDYDELEMLDLEDIEEVLENYDKLEMLDFDEIEEELESHDELEKSSIMSKENFVKRFGQSPLFITSTLREDGGVSGGTNAMLLMKEAIHVICCDYEEKTEWGKEVITFITNNEFLPLIFNYYLRRSFML